jgi:GTP diphosphokinase / guanosine-3',5'-bis(diphosphate) 3'-diphosphatase
MYKKALAFATEKHKGQKRKGGAPYILHPIRVSQSVEGDSAKIVALLHDVLEDTPTTIDEIKHFGDDVVDAVVAITHKQGESYVEYIERVKLNTIATQVKIADIADNLNDLPSEHATLKMAKALDTLLS